MKTRKEKEVRYSQQSYKGAVILSLSSKQVSYRCVRNTGYRGRLLTVCEYTSHLIECPYYKTIDIMSAYYGRKTGGHLCPGKVSTTYCPGYSDSRAIIERECQGYRWCRLRASNSVFGDPCADTVKYIEVSKLGPTVVPLCANSFPVACLTCTREAFLLPITLCASLGRVSTVSELRTRGREGISPYKGLYGSVRKRYLFHTSRGKLS